MAFKGTASKSSTGASMSKYDVEVEARLQALEKNAHPVPTGATQKKVDDRLAALEAAVAALQSSGGGGADPRVDKIINHIASKENIDDILS